MTGQIDGLLTRDEQPRYFAMIPDDLLRDLSVSGDAVRLWGILDRYAGETNAALPARKRLAADIGCSDRTISRLLSELAGAGWVVRTQRPGNIWDTHLNHRIRNSNKRRSDGGGLPTVSRGLDRSGATPLPNLARPRKQRLKQLEKPLSATPDEGLIPRSADPTSFDAFVEAYAPKGHCRRSSAKPVQAAWDKAITKAHPAVITAAARAYRAYRQNEEARGEPAKYQKQAATWLNAEEWLTDWPTVTEPIHTQAQDFWSRT